MPDYISGLRRSASRAVDGRWIQIGTRSDQFAPVSPIRWAERTYMHGTLV